jgi:hypothetical protein
MVQRVDYYALLSHAVETLEEDAYAARGAVYDREHKALLKRLINSSTPCSDADIAREERAFRDAIRRIEFPDGPVQAPRTPQIERGPASDWPRSSRDRARAQRREPPRAPPREPTADRERAPPRESGGRRQTDRDEPVADTRPPRNERYAEPDSAPEWSDEREKPRGSFIKLAAAYLLVTALLIGAGGLAYGYLVGNINVAGLVPWPGPSSTAPSRVFLFKSGQAEPVDGKASWGTRTEPKPDGKPDTVVTLQAEVTDPHLVMTMTFSRETSGGMSHLLQMQFAKPEDLPFGGITKISSVTLKPTQTDIGEALVGTSITIAPGQFMFGLLGVPDVVQQNLQRLRTQNWLGFTLVFGDGSTYTLTVEKGAAGDKAINDALTKWAQSTS